MALKPTIKDVAELAGVSVATVSCTLSGKKKVKAETRQLVMDAIAQLHYIPSSVAQSLRSEKSREIGIVLTDIDDDIHVGILKGLLDSAQKNNYTASVVFSKGEPQLEKELIEGFISKRVAGLVLLIASTELDEKIATAIRQDIPTIFLLRKPSAFEAHYASIDSLSTLRNTVARFAELNYKRISLVCGPKRYTNEGDLIKLFTEEVKRYTQLQSHSICETLFTKEDAFRVTMEAYSEDFPDAIICTAGSIGLGVLETLHVYGKQEHKDVTVVAFGAESWCNLPLHRSLITTSGNPYLLGYRALEAVISTFSSKQKGFYNIRMPDSFDVAQIQPLPKGKQNKKNLNAVRELRILAPMLQMTDALKLLTHHFEQIHPEIHIHYELAEHVNEIFNSMKRERFRKKCQYDLYMFDTPWTTNIALDGLLCDITDLVTLKMGVDNPTEKNEFSGAVFQKKIYGVPVGGGSQLLFYRRDLFSDPQICREYLHQTAMELGIPHTFSEFNRIARFFTKSYNPKSPTHFGTAFSSATATDLITYILPMIWAQGASTFNSKTLTPSINTPAFKRAILQFLEMTKYADPCFVNSALEDTTIQFAKGECAMIMTFSAFTTTLTDREFLRRKLGTALLPGRKPIQAGWAIGMSKYTSGIKEASSFLSWLLDPQINSYHTVLTGQEMHFDSLQSSELRRLYPWLNYTRQTRHYSKQRLPPYHPTYNKPNIPITSIEKVVTTILYRVLFDYMDIDQALEAGQNEMVTLFAKYGLH